MLELLFVFTDSMKMTLWCRNMYGYYLRWIVFYYVQCIVFYKVHLLANILKIFRRYLLLYNSSTTNFPHPFLPHILVALLRSRVQKFPACPAFQGDRNKTTLLFFNIVSLYFNMLFNWYINLTIDGTIYPSQRSPFGAPFVCPAGNVWTLLRIINVHTFIIWRVAYLYISRPTRCTQQSEICRALND